MATDTVEEIVSLLGSPISSDDFLTLLNIFPAFKVSFIIEETRKFLNFFSTYLREEEFRKRIFEIIQISYEICELIDNIPDVLLKTTFVNLLELYMDYTQIQRKDEMLNYLTLSFESLAPGPKILNLCLLVDPILNSKEYITDQSRLAEFEVVYVPMTRAEIQLKQEVDKWIKSQTLDPMKQDFLLSQLTSLTRALAIKLGISTSTEEYQELEIECREMLNMQLTVLSLMSELGDEDLSPKPVA
jgi:hypothetical protein